MKIEAIRKKSNKQLQEALKEGKEKIRDLRFKQASRQLKDVRILRKTKREVAMILTIINESESTQLKDE